MEISLSKAQDDIFGDPSRFKVVVAGRRFGKTVLALCTLLNQANAKRNSINWYTAPTYRQAKQIAWKMLQSFAPHAASKNETDLSMTFLNGSTIALRGADNYDCYDDLTEILTVEGWVFLKDLLPGVAVMTLNPATNEAEWQIPSRYIHEEYHGAMYQLSSKKLDLLVTPNHKFLVDTRKGVRKFKQVTEIAHQDHIPASVEWKGKDNPKYTDDILAFMGFYIAEGCARKDPGPKCSYEINFAQTKGIKGGLKGDVRAEFMEVMERLGIKYHGNEESIRVYGKKWWEVVHNLGLAYEKRIPKEILSLPPEKLKVILHWIIAGDGVVKSDGMRLLYTTSYELAGDIQELCMKIGQSAGIVEKPQVDAILKDGRIIKSQRPLYTVSIYRNKNIFFRDTKENYISEVPKFNGNIHCVEVSNHVIYVRRNGKATWSGNSLRGVGLDALVLDEYADMAAEVWTEVLRPSLSDKLGTALFIGTPAGFNHLYDLWIEADSKPDWKSWQFTTSDGGHVPKEELEAAKLDLDERTYKQEYEASFASLTGRVYYEFDRILNVSSDLKDTQAELLCGMDFNINPMSAVLGVKAGNQLHIIDEITIANGNTELMCDAIHIRYPARRIQVYPDPSGRARKTSSPVGQTDFSILASHGFRVLSPNAAPLVVDRNNEVNAMLKNAQGDRRLLVHPRCKQLIKCLDGLTFKEQTSQPDKGMGLDHLPDSLSYLVHYEYPIAQRMNKMQIAGI